MHKFLSLLINYLVFENILFKYLARTKFNKETVNFPYRKLQQLQAYDGATWNLRTS